MALIHWRQYLELKIIKLNKYPFIVPIDIFCQGKSTDLQLVSESSAGKMIRVRGTSKAIFRSTNYLPCH